jgi:serine/threonine protein kinase
MSKQQCPSPDDLKAYVLGHVHATTLDRFASHIDQCPPCEETVVDLEAAGDTVLTGLRKQVISEVEGERGLEQAMAFVRHIGQDATVGEAHAAKAKDAAPSIGTLREYELLEQIGEGGMGAVYKARHSKLDKIVAIKVLPTEKMKDAQAVARFEREMRAVGKLEHPNIVRAMDAGEVDGVHFLVMEYVKGRDLSQLSKQFGPLPIAEACDLIRQAAVGLDEAYDNNMVHRDIKPSNLILAERRRQPPVVKILDMGLAMLSDAHSPDNEALTTTGQTMGTLDYMAPEQGGDSKNVDIRADIYALGASLYRLLCGQVIFHGAHYSTPVQKLMALAMTPAPPIQERVAGISDELAAIVHRMLEKDPDARYATPQEIANALEPFCAGVDLGWLLADKRSEAPLDGARGASSQSPEPIVAAPSTTRTASPSIATASFVPLPVKTQPSARRKAPRNLLIAGGAGLLGITAVLASIIFFLQTSTGTLRVEINNPDIEVTVQGESIVLNSTDKEPITLAAGDHTLIVTRGDLTFQTNHFALTKGETTTVTVDLLPGKVQVVTAGNVIGEKTLERAPPPASGNPRSFEWQPTAEQQAFFDAVKQMPLENRSALVANKMQEIAFGRVEVTFDEMPHVKINAEACNQFWPLAAIDGIESIDFSGSGVVDFRPLQAMSVTSLTVDIPVYNSDAEAVLGKVATLKTINGLPVDRFIATRTETRTKIDEMARLAANLDAADAIAMMKPLLVELNPDGVSLEARGVSDRNVIGYSKEDGEFYLNARFCGGLRDLSPLRVLPFTKISLSGTQVFDLSPLAGLPLTSISINRSAVSDLSPLKGMPLKHVALELCLVNDLAPLADAHLESFTSAHCPVSDVSPLSGMPLTQLALSGMPVADLSPLKGMKLESFDCSNTPVSDISVLAGMPIASLDVRKGTPSDPYRWFKWGLPLGTVDDLSVLKGMPLKSLGVDYQPALREFLESLNVETLNGVPADRFWVSIRKAQNRFPVSGLAENLKSKSGLKMTPDEEREQFFDAIKDFPPQARQSAVVSKIAELANDGPEVTRSAEFAVELTPKGDAPTECIIDAWSVHQVWPLEGLKTLEKIDLVGSSVTDFQPLAKLAVRDLSVEVVLYNTDADQIFADIATLKTINGMPKAEFLAKRKNMRAEIDGFQKTAKSLKPIDIFPWIVPRFEELNPDCGQIVFTADGIQPGDSRISLADGLLKMWGGGRFRDLSPLRVLPFDRLQLNGHNNIGGRYIYDLSSLQGLPLISVSVGGCPLADLRPLKGMPLQNLDVSLTAVSDLTPLDGLPLESIGLQRTFVTDMSPLKKIKTLKTIDGKPATEVLGGHGGDSAP